MPMPVKVTATEIPDVLVVESAMARDDRGFFSELYSSTMFEAVGIGEQYLQDNISESRKGTMRGLHYQLRERGMGKLVRVLRGSVFDVAVDLRRGSPWFGKWVGRTLNADRAISLWIPVGFAHGFTALEDNSLVIYKCTAVHAPEMERAVNHADPTVGLRWPISPTLVSPKDAAAPLLSDAEYDFEYAG